jgi:hypothetical protein
MPRAFEEVALPHLDAAGNYARWLTKSAAPQAGFGPASAERERGAARQERRPRDDKTNEV